MYRANCTASTTFSSYFFGLFYFCIFSALTEDDDTKENDANDLYLMEKQLEAALLQESALSSKEEQDLITGSEKEDAAKLSKTFDDELVNSLLI